MFWFSYLDFLLCRAHCVKLFVCLLKYEPLTKVWKLLALKSGRYYHSITTHFPFLPSPISKPIFPTLNKILFISPIFETTPNDSPPPPPVLFSINPSLLGWCLVVYPPNYRLIAYVYLICYGSRESSAKHSLSSRIKRNINVMQY